MNRHSGCCWCPLLSTIPIWCMLLLLNSAHTDLWGTFSFCNFLPSMTRTALRFSNQTIRRLFNLCSISTHSQLQVWGLTAWEHNVLAVSLTGFNTYASTTSMLSRNNAVDRVTNRYQVKMLCDMTQQQYFPQTARCKWDLDDFKVISAIIMLFLWSHTLMSGGGSICMLLIKMKAEI